jgi:hypothetical protein
MLIAGAVFVSAWFMLPWLEILGRVRHLRFPIIGKLGHRFPPSEDDFPDLASISAEIEAAGFTEADNTGWKWEGTDHFMRLFYHADLRLQAAASLAAQETMAVSYVSVTSRTTDGRSVTTSNYPFSYSMQFGPQHLVQRFEAAESFTQLTERHEKFLQELKLSHEHLADQDPDALVLQIEQDMEQQIRHNVAVGVLLPAGEHVFRYSWRGYLFLWRQIVWDMLRV